MFLIKGALQQKQHRKAAIQLSTTAKPLIEYSGELLIEKVNLKPPGKLSYFTQYGM